MAEDRLGKRMKRTLEYLGKEYTTRTIDGEVCIYRDLGNGFDIEISGVSTCDGKRKVCNFICVWDVRAGKGFAAKSVAYVREPATLHSLKRALDRLAAIDWADPLIGHFDVYASEWLGGDPK